jgi:hypothetical protein
MSQVIVMGRDLTGGREVTYMGHRYAVVDNRKKSEERPGQQVKA